MTIIIKIIITTIVIITIMIIDINVIIMILMMIMMVMIIIITVIKGIEWHHNTLDGCTKLEHDETRYRFKKTKVNL